MPPCHDRSSRPPPAPGPRPRGQRGSATVHVLSMVVLLTAMALGATGFAGLATAKHRAAAAADLAALAAAAAPAEGCALAAATARRNGGRLTRCRREGSDVTVTVVVAARAPFGLRPTLTASARAGPAP